MVLGLNLLLLGVNGGVVHGRGFVGQWSSGVEHGHGIESLG
jgi:hypothetical protein